MSPLPDITTLTRRYLSCVDDATTFGLPNRDVARSAREALTVGVDLCCAVDGHRMPLVRVGLQAGATLDYLAGALDLTPDELAAEYHAWLVELVATGQIDHATADESRRLHTAQPAEAGGPQ